MAVYSAANRAIWGSKDAQIYVRQFSKDLADNKCQKAFVVKNKLIGNAVYNITGYRSAFLRNQHNIYIIFRIKDEEKFVPDFLVTHNWYTKDYDLQNVFDVFFEFSSQETINQIFSDLKNNGFFSLRSIDEMINGKGAAGTKRAIEQEQFTKIFTMFFEFAHKKAMEMA